MEMGITDLTRRIVLGTAQFGSHYGIVNTYGKAERNEIFATLDLAWESGIRRFDTAPSYDSEQILGQFIAANGVADEVVILTKVSSLQLDINYIRESVEGSLAALGCNIDVLFLHDPNDAAILLEESEVLQALLQQYPISGLGVSVYEPKEVSRLSSVSNDLAFQYPLNLLDRRFQSVEMPKGKRYARSIFLQGLLAAADGLRKTAPPVLVKLQNQYHAMLRDYCLDPVGIAVSFIAHQDTVDYFLIGIDSVNQLQSLLDVDIYTAETLNTYEDKSFEEFSDWLDPRQWS